MRTIQVHPREIIIEELEQELASGNYEILDQIGENSIRLDKEEEGAVFASAILYNQELPIEQRKKFLSKIDITSAQKSHHFVALCGMINPARDVEMLKYALAAGFDPGADNGYHDVLEIAVQQCQKNSKKETEISFVQPEVKNASKDIDMIELMLRTGKINGFPKVEGEREAEKVRLIKANGIFPQECQIIEDSLSEEKSYSLTRSCQGRLIKAAFNDNNINAARAYVSHLYYNERSPKESADCSKVDLEVLEGKLSNSQQKPSTILESLTSIFSCCFNKSAEIKSSR